MSQILTQVEAILKDKYQPALANLINIEPSPFLEMIRKEPLTNNKVRMAAPVGINGGFGFGAEGAATPVSGAQRYVEYTLDAVDMYVDIQISNKTVQLASSNASAMINALDQEIKGSYRSAEWNLSRALFGNGDGVLCAVASDSITTDGKTSTIKVSDTNRLIEGLIVDIYKYTAAEATEGTLITEGKAVRVVNVDRRSKTVTVEGTGIDVDVALTKRGITASGTYGFITVQNSHNRELCGLGAIFDNYTPTIYGIEKASNKWIKPIEVNCECAVNDVFLFDGIKEAADFKGTKIDLIMMGDDAFKMYQEYMRSNNIVITEKHHFIGGAVGYKILCGSQETVIVNEKFVPSDEAWGVDTSTLYLETTPWEFMSKDGAVFLPMPNTSVYRALLTSYGNLVCTNPGGCVRFTECAGY